MRKYIGKLIWSQATMIAYGPNSMEVIIPFTVTDIDYYNQYNDCFRDDIWECVEGVLKRKNLYPPSRSISNLSMKIHPPADVQNKKLRFIVHELSQKEIVMYTATSFSLMLKRKSMGSNA